MAWDCGGGRVALVGKGISVAVSPTVSCLEGVTGVKIEQFKLLISVSMRNSVQYNALLVLYE